LVILFGNARMAELDIPEMYLVSTNANVHRDG